ncbi:MAG TPA: hypothetical protein VIJ10_07970 [Vicinamibacteria bacterium]
MTSAQRERLPALAATALAAAASLLAIAGYLVRAGVLVSYPWDWSPDEGLYLDHARRLVQDPASLHARSFVPFPSAYGPALLLLLAPFASATTGALFAARLVALGWTLAGTLAVFWLVRRDAPPLLALAACALALAPLDLTFWHMLVRPDGLMLACLLLAAVALMPASLAPGRESLSTTRMALGTAALLAAVLAKATAVVHGAPLVLGWLLVDRRSAWRLMSCVGAAGLGALLLLQWLTAGGFLWVNGIWSYHPSQSWLPALVVRDFLALAWPLPLLALVSFLLSGERRAALRDGAVLLLVGALLVLPLATKYGASWNYLVPAVPALAVLTARWWAGAGVVLGLPRPTAGAAILALAALVLSMTRHFPLPTAEDARTARAFYTYVADLAREKRGPILAVRPEYAYYHVGQPVEMEGSALIHLAAAHAPGTERIEASLEQARYSLLIWAWPLPETGRYREAAFRSYAAAGGCKLGYYFGQLTATLLPRRDLFRPMQPQAGTRCGTSADAQKPAD